MGRGKNHLNFDCAPAGNSGANPSSSFAPPPSPPPPSSPTLWINVPTLSLFWLLGVKLVSRRCTASPTFLYCNLPCKLLLPLEQQYSPCPERIRYTVTFSRDDSFLIGNFFFSPFLFSLPFVGNFSFAGSDGNLFLFIKKKSKTGRFPFLVCKFLAFEARFFAQIFFAPVFLLLYSDGAGGWKVATIFL